MGGTTLHSLVWRLVRSQHGLITRRQLLDLGFSAKAIEHRIAAGRLHPVYRGVYAVGRPELTRYGRWMAATLACSPSGALSHGSAAALWRIWWETAGLEVSVSGFRSQPGITAHRRHTFDVTTHRGIPVTTVVCTIVDLAARLPPAEIERVIDNATTRGLTDPDAVRAALHAMPPRPGTAKLAKTLDVRTFALTRSELERLFLPIARRAGLPKPLTRAYVNGFEVDFFWPKPLGIVVETDSLSFHRTPAQLYRDRVRDHAHHSSGLIPLRFTHGQIRYEPAHVEDTLNYTSSIVSASSPTSRNPV